MGTLSELRAAQRDDRGLVREVRRRIRKRGKRIKEVAAQLRLVAKLKRHRVRKPLLVIREAERAGLALANALAMLEKETGIPQRNIFGCDHGSASGVPFCNQAVTATRVDQLIASGLMNGVGWTQITWWEFVREAERLGGAHLVRNQLRVGFRVLAGHIRSNGRQDGFRAYNGSGPDAEAYGRHAVELAERWQERLR